MLDDVYLHELTLLYLVADNIVARIELIRDRLKSSLREVFAAALCQRVVVWDENLSILDLDLDNVSSLGAYYRTL